MNKKLLQDYYKRAQIRYEVLEVYREKEDYADVVKEAQEIVELLLKAALMKSGLTVPKIHDIGKYIRENIEFFSDNIKKNIDKIAAISRELRKERELAFYGAEDWIPLDEYTDKHAKAAINQVSFILDIIGKELE